MRSTVRLLALTVTAITAAVLTPTPASAALRWSGPERVPLALVCVNSQGHEVSFHARKAPGVRCYLTHRVGRRGGR